MDFRRCQIAVATALMVASLAGLPVYGQSAPAGDSAPVAQPSSTADQKPLAPYGSADENRKLGRERPSTWMPWVQTLAALALVAGLIFLAGRLLRRAGRGGAVAGNEVFEILARKSIGPKQQLLLVRIGKRILVVGSSAAGLNALSEFNDEREIAALAESIEAAKGESFLHILHRKTQQARTAAAESTDAEQTAKALREAAEKLRSRLAEGGKRDD